MSLKITPRRAALGAVVEGLDVSGPLGADLVAELHAAWMQHLVLFFPGLGLDDEQQVRLGEAFGDLAATTDDGTDHRRQDSMADAGYPQVLVLDSSSPRFIAPSMWHTDVTFAEIVPIGALLSMRIAASSGGDTMWLNQYRAYETLHPGLQRLADELVAIHGRPPSTGTAEHPVVIEHPVTKRRALFVNRGWTMRIKDMSPIEGNHVLSLLCEHAERPENQVRWSYTTGDAVLWDNRVTQHYAVGDYGKERRRIHRVAIYDRDTPFAP